MPSNQTETDPRATFDLRLDGNGINVDRSVDITTAWRIMALVMEADGVPAGVPGATGAAPKQMTSSEDSAPPPAPTRAELGTGGMQSLREYLDEHEPGRNVEKIVAIAAYLEVRRTMQTFKQQDIKSAFREASEALPGNFGRDFNWARKTGWIANADGKRGEYYVTDSGKKAVAAKFPADLRKKTRVSKGSRKRPKVKTAGADE